MSEKRTLIVNLYGGPGTGKSTSSTYIFSKLKMEGVDAEYVSEFAKDKVWEQNVEVFKNQFYITGKQAFKISRCFGKVDVIVTDSPIRMGIVYADSPELKKAIEVEANKYKNNEINVFLQRVKPYNPNGRRQTEEEAKEMDKVILKMLMDTETCYATYNGNLAGCNAIVDWIKSLLEASDSWFQTLKK